MRRSALTLTFVASLAASVSAQVIITPEGYATTPAAVSGIFAPLLVTPVAHLESSPQAVGATAAAAGQQVGATTSPATRILTPTPPSIVPRVINAAPMVYVTSPSPQPPGIGIPGQAEQQPGAAAELGVSPLDPSATLSGRSLAQAAAEVRRGAQPQVPRNITNADIQRLNQQTRPANMGAPATPPQP
ncbi:MAG: hypothetical protein AB7O65_08620 [Candidatus Korobacteraceae bacterium]